EDTRESDGDLGAAIVETPFVAHAGRRWFAARMEHQARETSARTPDDQLGVENELVGHFLALEGPEREVRGAPALLVKLRGDRREWRNDVVDFGDVVKPDEGDVLRHAHAPVDEGGEGRQGGGVVEGDDGLEIQLPLVEPFSDGARAAVERRA